MFNAQLISLSDGQSYENVRVCEEEDLVKFNIPFFFEEWTACIFAEKKTIVIHHWKIKVIQLDKIRRGGGPKSIRAERLVLDGDIIYPQPLIIHQDGWIKAGIPHYFVKRSGIAGQLVFSTEEGTFITHDVNCTSIILPEARKSGITAAVQPKMTPIKIAKASAIPDTVRGKVGPRKKV